MTNSRLAQATIKTSLIILVMIQQALVIAQPVRLPGLACRPGGEVSGEERPSQAPLACDGCGCCEVTEAGEKCGCCSVSGEASEALIEVNDIEESDTCCSSQAPVHRHSSGVSSIEHSSSTDAAATWTGRSTGSSPAACGQCHCEQRSPSAPPLSNQRSSQTDRVFAGGSIPAGSILPPFCSSPANIWAASDANSVELHFSQFRLCVWRL